jgi:glutathione peroxidase
MFEKTHAARPKADPIYKTLGELAGEYPAWNFHKYILDRNGNLVASFNSRVEPKSSQILSTIQKLL